MAVRNEDMAKVTSEYLYSMERFCDRNFNTTRLPECRVRLERAYEEVW